jgi:hypothetical protein
MHFPTQKRGDAKLHLLSPRRHLRGRGRENAGCARERGGRGWETAHLQEGRSSQGAAGDGGTRRPWPLEQLDAPPTLGGEGSSGEVDGRGRAPRWRRRDRESTTETIRAVGLLPLDGPRLSICAWQMTTAVPWWLLPRLRRARPGELEGRGGFLLASGGCDLRRTGGPRPPHHQFGLGGGGLVGGCELLGGGGLSRDASHGHADDGATSEFGIGFAFASWLLER